MPEKRISTAMMKLKYWKPASCIAVICVWTTLTATARAQTFNTLVNFDGTNGANPQAALVQGIDGSLYGTLSDGGDHAHGTVFKLGAGGKLTTLYSFCAQANCVDGANPYGSLVLATDGNFYGTTLTGGEQNFGTVFKVTRGGKLTTLRSFCQQLYCPDGATPVAGLVQGTDGNFYGTTEAGGEYMSGTVFKITSAGALTTLYSFCSQNCTDGASPFAGLVQANDGNFYGTTWIGGSFYGDGTIFKITPAGELTTIYRFCLQSDCLDGAQPQAGLVQATDGNLYGTTTQGGAGSDGTVFKLTPGGKLTTLYSFCTQANCTDGGYPQGGLVQGTDGNLYGTTVLHGGKGYGTVFQINRAGTMTTVHNFDSTDGANAMAALLQATNGSFYGTTNLGGSGSGGTLFGMSADLGPFVAFVNGAGKAGQRVGILGQGFTGTSGVSLDGSPVIFKVESNTLLIATIPTGATTGYVTVTTPSGTLTSNKPFLVIP
jgi:uncharacterized repeat protein (TIGR03803 family)